MVWRREEPRESQLAEGCSTLFSRQARRARGGAAAEGHVRRGARGAVAGVGARGPPAQAPGGVHGGTAGVHEELHHGVSRMSMWSLWKARPRAPGRGVLSPGEYGSAEKSGREVRKREIRYLKPAEAAAHILGKCKENVFNGRPVGRPLGRTLGRPLGRPPPPTPAAARQPLGRYWQPGGSVPLWTLGRRSGRRLPAPHSWRAKPHFSERFLFVE